MPRPVSIQDEVILSAARELFLERGIDVATSEIAARAGVSQGIIFKRFRTKQALFNAAMKVQNDWGDQLSTLLQTSIGQKDIESTLTDLGTIFIDKFLVIIPMLMMSWSNKQETLRPAGAEICAPEDRAARALRAVRAVASYLKAESGLSRIRQADFEIVAQAFVGALWHKAFLEVMLGADQFGPAKQRRYVARLVRSLWTGIVPDRCGDR